MKLKIFRIQYLGSNLNLNNYSYTSNIDGYRKYTSRYKFSGRSVEFYLPENWEASPGSKQNLELKSSIEDWAFEIDKSYDISYDEYLNVFIDKLKNTATFPESVEIHTEEIEINGSKFKIIVEEDGYGINSYFLLIQDFYEYYIEFSTNKDYYNDNEIKIKEIRNTIFSSFHVKDIDI